MLDRLAHLPWWLWLIVTLVSALGSLAAVTWTIVHLPVDALVPRQAQAPGKPLRRIAVRVVRTIGGLLVLGLGLLMALPGVPGQGLLTVLLALLLLEFPGKQRLFLHLLQRRPGLVRTADRVRARWGRAPLQPP